MFESLRSLSDSQIVSGSKAARAQEHGGLLSMIGFVVETERRKLYLARGYSSLFDYCTRELGYSESQAMRRITAARCIVKFPPVFELLKANELNLGTISRVSKILTPENCRSVLGRIRKKSLREVETIVAEYEPAAAFPPDRVRTIVARVPVNRTLPMGENHLRNDGRISSTVDALTPANGHAGDSPEAPGATVVTELQFERRARVEFTAHEELMEKLARIRSLVSHRLPANAPLEQLLGFMADYVIQREDPVKRHERRQARSAKQEKKTTTPVAPPGPRIRQSAGARLARCT